MGRNLIRKSKKSELISKLNGILGGPPLIPGERQDHYDRLLEHISQSVEQRDDLDSLFVRDFTYITWQIAREQRIERAILALAQKEVVIEFLKSTYDSSDVVAKAKYHIFCAEDDGDRWANDPEAGKEIDARLAASGISSDVVLAKAYAKVASQLEYINKRIADYERRRSAILKDIERRDEALARKLGAATSKDVIDAEFSDAAD